MNDNKKFFAAFFFSSRLGRRRFFVRLKIMLSVCLQLSGAVKNLVAMFTIRSKKKHNPLMLNVFAVVGDDVVASEAKIECDAINLNTFLPFKFSLLLKTF